MLPVLFALLALLALVAGVTFGTGWFQGQHFGKAANATSTTQPKPTATRTKPVVTATPTTKPPTATAGTTPQPTQAPPVYPILGKTYEGQVTNTGVNENAPITISRVAQNNASISGFLYIAPGHDLLGSGNFTGTVSTDNTIQFVVASYAGYDPLAFSGTIQANRSILGTYCGIANGKCDYTQGHGTWSTNPPSANSAPQNNGYFARTATDIYNESKQN